MEDQVGEGNGEGNQPRDLRELAAMPERGDGLVFQICREVQREHWNPPVGIEVAGPLPRKYGTL